MKELNILQMEEMHGGNWFIVFACIGAGIVNPALGVGCAIGAEYAAQLMGHGS